jgi:hypothetical protein
MPASITAIRAAHASIRWAHPSNQPSNDSTYRVWADGMRDQLNQPTFKKIWTQVEEEVKEHPHIPVRAPEATAERAHPGHWRSVDDVSPGAENSRLGGTKRGLKAALSCRRPGARERVVQRLTAP